MDAIRVENLSVSYENNPIIKELDLSIPKGKISIIIGANGCGKSTLLKTISRINKPVSGDIFINDKDIKNVKAKDIAKEVAFLGLLSPHMAKRIVGTHHRKFLVISAMISVIIILIADAVSRNLFSPIEIPVGITVSIFGVPYFIYLIIKEK